jgi:hypothetical protein
LPQNALLLLQVGQQDRPSNAFILVNAQVRSKGLHKEYWNGRDGTGVILDYARADFPIMIAYQIQSLPDNSLVVIGAQGCAISISSDPYVFLPSFGEFINIKYTISLPGVVSVSICKPSGELVKALQNGVSNAAGTYELTWDGSDAAGKVVAKDDDYMIKVDFTGSDGKTISSYGNVTTR